MFDRVRPIDAEDAGNVTRKGYVLEVRTPLARAAAQTCSHCGARVKELRRGRCWGCYQAWVGLRPVGLGARCVVCYERRTDALRRVELHGRWLPMCHSCAARAQTLSTVPYTIDGLRRGLDRERRGNDRRVGAVDARAFPDERRQADRRLNVPRRCTDPTDDAPAVPDDVVDDLLALPVSDADVIEATRVTETPTTSRPRSTDQPASAA